MSTDTVSPLCVIDLCPGGIQTLILRLVQAFAKHPRPCFHLLMQSILGVKISIYEHGVGGEEYYNHSDHSNAHNQTCLQVTFSLYNEQLQFKIDLHIPLIIFGVIC